MTTYLSQSQHAQAITQLYQTFFLTQLNTSFSTPPGEGKDEETWTESSIMTITKGPMADAAMRAVFGTKIFEAIPDLLRELWEFDKVLETILFCPPKWLFPNAYAVAEGFCGKITRFFEDSIKEKGFTVEEEEEEEWEERLGSRWFREMARWMVESGFEPRSCGGFAAVVGMVA